MTDNEKSYISLEQAKNLVLVLEQGNVASANELLEDVSREIQQDIFDSVGKITRDLHNAISQENMDERFSSLVSNCLPDAKERLNYVIDMSAQAANKTMDAVDECVPLAKKHQTTVTDILPSWERLKDCKIKLSEFRQLREKLDLYFAESVTDAELLNEKLNDIVLAQSYQDLTGQVLQKITELVYDVEQNLISLLKLLGSEKSNKEQQRIDDCVLPDGPVVPKAKQHDVVEGQDDVDDLLSSLGF